MRTHDVLIIITLLATVSSAASTDRLRFDSLRRGQREVSVYWAAAESHRIPRRTTELTTFQLVKVRMGNFVSPREEYAMEVAAAQERENPKNDGFVVVGSYRRFFAIRGCTALAFDAGFGVMCFEKRLISQSTRINFTEHLGLSLHYAIGAKTTVAASYVFSHNSNAGLRLPNLGINASIWSIGVCFYP
ncbi:MAG: acyloxyacyl hydrolase [Armatimonadota bacterium]|nr:acyloxyacyl hydrolase [Armatimonadota bacterium]